MGKIIFILGGSRSGKSSFAVKMAEEKTQKTAFIATCQPLDREMKGRIRRHKNVRPASWKTFEEPKNITLLLKKISPEFRVIIIDCLTLLVSNLMLEKAGQKTIEKEMTGILGELKKSRALSIIVSNEVGLGIVPEGKLARDFRDIAGRINQLTAEKADEVFFMFSGLPLKMKSAL